MNPVRREIIKRASKIKNETKNHMLYNCLQIWSYHNEMLQFRRLCLAKSFGTHLDSRLYCTDIVFVIRISAFIIYTFFLKNKKSASGSSRAGMHVPLKTHFNLNQFWPATTHHLTSSDKWFL